MSFWSQPLDFGKIWRGPQWRTPFATYACTWLGRMLVVGSFVLLAVFFLAMVAFEVALAIHDPALSLGIWTTVGVATLLIVLWRRSHRAPPVDPDDPVDGAGIPIPRVPSPELRVGAAAQGVPFERRRLG